MILLRRLLPAIAALLGLTAGSHAQDNTLVTALHDLERAVRAAPGPRHLWTLFELSEVYGDAGSSREQARLLNELVGLTADDTVLADRPNLPRMIAQKLHKVDDIDALQRLVPQDPRAPWVEDVEIRAGNRAVLLDSLSGPQIHRVSVIQSVERYLKGVMAREGTDGVKREVLEIARFIARKTSGVQTAEARQLAEGWSNAVVYWLPDLLRDADRRGQIVDMLDWAQRVTGIERDAIDGAIVSFVDSSETAGVERPFGLLQGRLQSNKDRLSMIGWAVGQRLQRGRIDSALALTRRILDSPGNMAAAMDTTSYSSASSCTGPRKPRLALDRSHAFVQSGFVDCGSLGETSLLQVLGEKLARARQYEPARKVLDYVLTVERRPSDRPCPPSARSRDLAYAYFAVGATDLVREYAELIAHTCIVDVTNAYFVGRMMTLLDSPDAVAELMKARRFQTEAAGQRMVLGWITGLVERGAASQLPAALRMAEDKQAAVAQVHDWLRDASIVEDRRKAAAILGAALPLLRDQYLVFDSSRSFLVSQAPQWMVAYAELGLGAQVKDLIREMADRSVDAINATANRRGDAVRSEDSRRDILALATLFLASRLIEPGLDVQRWASRLEHKLMQRMFLAIGCEALALTGDVDGAVRLAVQLDPFGPRLEIGDYYGPNSFTWRALISLQARNGDLSGAYRFARDHQRGVYIPSLVSDFRQGLAERGK